MRRVVGAQNIRSCSSGFFARFALQRRLSTPAIDVQRPRRQGCFRTRPDTAPPFIETPHRLSPDLSPNERPKSPEYWVWHYRGIASAAAPTHAGVIVRSPKRGSGSTSQVVDFRTVIKALVEVFLFGAIQMQCQATGGLLFTGCRFVVRRQKLKHSFIRTRDIPHLFTAETAGRQNSRAHD